MLLTVMGVQEHKYGKQQAIWGSYRQQYFAPDALGQYRRDI